MYRYAASISRDEDVFAVGVRALPEIVTQGDSIEEALAAARDAVDEAIANRIVMALPIPKSDAKPNARYVASPSAYVTLKAALHEAMAQRRVSRVRLARMLDVGETEVRRMLDPRHATRFQRLEKALRLLGTEVRVELRRIA